MNRGTDTTRALRGVSVGLTALGTVHLLAPRVLLDTARRLYGRVLRVRFESTEQSAWRVRAIGVCLLAVAAALARFSRDRDRTRDH
ncbi:MAG: hypothetical protein A07HR67_00742 [uncultured archaeon A07HR67]|jgi:hypothetical protein|nr:MAG: hypothetical protein A07HR67_00742 [uncultured archaeon A07HR67]